MPKRRSNPGLLCVEPAQLPFEGVLGARAAPRVIPATEQQVPLNKIADAAVPTGERVLTRSNARSGKTIPHVDSLSRHICSLTREPSLTKARIRQEQTTDAYCQSVDTGNRHPRSEYFRDADGVLYKRKRGGEPLLVIPESLIREIITLNHDSVYAGHPGVKRTLGVLSLKYWWPTMSGDVRKYVSTCDACQRRDGKREFKAPLGDVAEPSRAFQIVHIDITGPYPRTSAGNRYVLTAIDKLTKYAEAIPLKDISAVTVARAYATQIVSRHGVNETLVSDKGSNFMSEFFNETCKILGVKHINTTAYHPQANGSVERWHRTMNRAIGFYVNSTGTNWDVLLPFFLMSYRSLPHTVSGYSPFYLLHGREMEMPHSHGLRARLSPGARRLDEAGRLQNLKSALRLANRTVRERIQKSHARNKRYYDKTAKERVIVVGDIVYLHDPARRPNLFKKWANPWRGPFKVTQQVGKLDFRIIDTKGKETVVHVNRLKVARSPAIWQPETAETRPIRKARRQRKARVDESHVTIPSRRILVPLPRTESPERTPACPVRIRPDIPDSPDVGEKTPLQHRTDRNYSPPSSPRSRNELRTTRLEPPTTRARARRQADEQ